MSYITNNNLTQNRLKEVIEYIPETGAFYRLEYKGAKDKHILIGDGIKSKITIHIDGATYQGSRLAFLYMNGEFPCSVIVHNNSDLHDYRWSNLKEYQGDKNKKLTQGMLKKLLKYEPLTGDFIRLMVTSSSTVVGDIAGYTQKKWL